MSTRLGFVLITHNQPAQTAFLCQKLSSMFDDPPIVVHHDYSQSFLDPATLPSQVRIVQNWVKTSWGASSVIDAYLEALRVLHQENAPEWTVNLSSADYPIKSAEVILRDFEITRADAFLDFREISHGLVQPADARSHAAAFQRPEYLRLARKRYLAFSVVHYYLRKWIGRADRAIYLNNRWATMLLSPFSRAFRPYAGDWWHAVNRRAAAVLLRRTKRARALRRYYDKRDSAEESYMHTILANEPELRIENDNRRYTVWPVGAPHPKTFSIGDIPALVASDAHFARKFPFDPDLYEAIDAEVARQQSPSGRATNEE